MFLGLWKKPLSPIQKVQATKLVVSPLYNHRNKVATIASLLPQAAEGAQRADEGFPKRSPQMKRGLG